MVGVSPNGKGEKAGFMVGDLIKEINHKEITSTETYNAVIHKTSEGEPLQFFIRRINAGFMVIRMEK